MSTINISSSIFLFTIIIYIVLDFSAHNVTTHTAFDSIQIVLIIIIIIIIMKISTMCGKN